MKSIRLRIIVAAVSLAAGFQSTAMADDKSLGDGNTNWQEHTRSAKSRAEVKAELKQAREQGQLDNFNDSTYPGPTMAQSNRSRGDVRNEAAHTQRSSGGLITNHNYPGNQ